MRRLKTYRRPLGTSKYLGTYYAVGPTRAVLRRHLHNKMQCGLTRVQYVLGAYEGHNSLAFSISISFPSSGGIGGRSRTKVDEA